MNEKNRNLSFQEFLNSKFKERGLGSRRVSELTGISVKHLEALSAGNTEELPPAPYLHGYLKKLGELLGFDPDLWWEELKKSESLKKSGGDDQLPKNRFAKQKEMQYLWVVALLAILAIFFGLRYAKIFGEPTVALFDSEKNISTTNIDHTVIRGTLSDGNTVTVNGEAVEVKPDGSWEKLLNLEPGPNFFEIVGKKFLGRKTTITREIIYEPATTTPASNGPLPPENP